MPTITIPDLFATTAPHDRLATPVVTAADVNVTIDDVTSPTTNPPVVQADGSVTVLATDAEYVTGARFRFEDAVGDQWLGQTYHVDRSSELIASIADRLTPQRMAKLDRDLAHADAAPLYRGQSIVTPAFANVARRDSGGVIRVYNDESLTVHTVVSDASGIVDLTGLDLWFGVEGEDRRSVFSAAATGVADGFEITVEDLTATSCDLWWALRMDDATGKVIASGKFEIAYRPYDRA